MDIINARRTDDGTTVLDVRGELDASMAAGLRDAMATALGTSPDRIVVDVQYVTFMDSTGLGALVAAYDAAQAIGVPFRLTNPSPFVAHVLNVTGLADRLAPLG